jgi:hypothetical protein
MIVNSFKNPRASSVGDFGGGSAARGVRRRER